MIVTGGVRGLGRALVDLLLAKDAKVSVFDLDGSELKRLSEERQIHGAQCDLADYDQVLNATEEYYKQFGAPDVLVNNAGILYSAPLLKLGAAGIEKHPVEAWRKVIAADLESVFFMSACIAEKMVITRTRGVIVNVSSVSAAGNAGQSAYSAAKAGVNALTAVWAKELSPMGVRVVGVAPGFTDTESTKQALSESALGEVIKKVPLRRLGRPDEIAAGIISIIENDFFNGKVFQLDGGLVI